MLGKIGITELVVVLVIAFLIFGPAKLPQLGKSVGEGIREFKKAFRTVREDESEASAKGKQE
ncbi:MAG: twin-arginine translocation protein TatA/E family subunit [Symbiobacteriaceae bacterium]|jgi:sec-independent protein translocase protein TatA|nr:twin-arginine translocation protein TatA/E family subunit [Symbiobacteriaceae bacterium]